MDHVLTRAGLALRTVEPVFALSRSVTDVHDTRFLCAVLTQLTGPADRAALSPG